MGAFLAGLVTGLGLIVAIGAQNVFVLRQGIARRHTLATALTVTACDVGLIALGVGGVGSAVASQPWLARLVGLAGAAFLLVYGALALRSAVRAEAADWTAVGAVAPSRRVAVGAALAVSLLNPHVYLDTVVLLGGIGGQLPPRERLTFAVGACVASALWFFGLAYGARALTPWFRRRSSRRVLDGFVALVMWVVAALLLRETL